MVKILDHIREHDSELVPVVRTYYDDLTRSYRLLEWECASWHNKLFWDEDGWRCRGRRGQRIKQMAIDVGKKNNEMFICIVDHYQKEKNKLINQIARSP